MAKSRSWSSTAWREWERRQRAAEREHATAVRAQDQQRKAQERARVLAGQQARAAEATRGTEQLGRRVAELEQLLRSSLPWHPRVDLDARELPPGPVPLDLGALALPVPAPDWAAFAPAEPGPVSRLLGGQRRYESDLAAAQEAFARARGDHPRAELERQRKAADAIRADAGRRAAAAAAAAERNERSERFARAVRGGERHAVGEYFRAVLSRSPYPQGFPPGRRAAYVPESTMLVVEHELPGVEVVPAARAVRYVKTRDALEALARPAAEVRRRYRDVLAQVALRTVREVFASDPADLVQTVVFNGVIRHLDPATGRGVETCLLSFRSTRERFTELVLDRLDPVDCLRRHFFADVSPHPDELTPVEPVLRFDMADPRVTDPVDIMSELDRRPNLLELSPTEFESFIQNLFSRMEHIEAKLFRASNDGGVDCVAYDTRSIFGGKFVVQAKLYTKQVPPSAVRDLYGTMQHEGATKGILITTSGYGPSSYEFANGKPLDLINKTGLLALCHRYDIPARIPP